MIFLQSLLAHVNFFKHRQILKFFIFTAAAKLQSLYFWYIALIDFEYDHSNYKIYVYGHVNICASQFYFL